MINITEDIHSLTDFKKNTSELIRSLKKTKRPTILTVNGKAEIVIMDAASYQKIQEQSESTKDILEIKQSLKDFESGKFSCAKNVFSDLKKRIPNSKESTKTKHR